jgi:predicted ATPase
MNNINPFEKEIKQTYRLPDADPAFFNRLEAKLQANQHNPEAKAKPTFHFVRGWVYAAATLIFLSALVFAIGPSNVLAQIQAVFGFVPNVGLVDTSSPFRQLAEPVSDTRDGVTLNIHSAFLSADGTIITYTMSDLPAEIKHARFGEPECNLPAYLTFPDGSKIEAYGSSSGITPDGSYANSIRFIDPVPANFNQATLVFPCLEGTARDKGPEDWQFALAFKPAPENLAVYPATLMPLQADIESTVPVAVEKATLPESETAASAMPTMIVDGDRLEEMVILGVLEKPDSYWVTWAFPGKRDNDIQINGQLYVVPFNPVLYDANGTELPEPDHETQLQLWQYEESLRSQLSGQDQLKYLGSMYTFAIPKSGVAFPVYAKQNVYERSFPEKEAYAEIEFDGSKVQTSDNPVEINQEIQLGSVKFTLSAIEKNQFGGYSFIFNGTEGKVVQCLAALVGYSTNMGGGSSFNPDDPFHFYQAEMYSQIPTGMLTVRVSQPAVLGDMISFIGSWSPEK